MFCCAELYHTLWYGVKRIKKATEETEVKEKILLNLCALCGKNLNKPTRDRPAAPHEPGRSSRQTWF